MKKLIVLTAACVLAVAAIATVLILHFSHKNSIYGRFADKGLADAMKSAYGYSSHYDIKQEDLDAVEGLVYFVQIGMDTSGGSGSASSYAYPVVMLCDKTYTDLLIEQSDPAYEAPETTEEGFIGIKMYVF